MKKLAIAALAIMFMASACSKEEKPVEYGTATLSIEQGASVFVKAGNPIDDTYEITSTADAFNGKTYSQIQGQTFTMATGTYTISAENISETVAETDRGAQRFHGATEFEVTANSKANVSFECKMANARVSFTFADSFKEFFDVNNSTTPAKISASTGTIGTDRTIEYNATATLAADDSQIAYFNTVPAGKTLTFTISACRKIDGVKKEYTKTISILPQYWHQVTISASTTSGQAGLEITVDQTITEATHPFTVDPFDNN